MFGSRFVFAAGAAPLALLLLTSTPGFSADTDNGGEYSSAESTYRWPRSGSDTARIGGETLGVVEWGRARAVATGSAYAPAGATMTSNGYWRAVYQAKQQAMTNLDLLLVDVARGRGRRIDPIEARNAALHAFVLHENYHAYSGKVVISLAAALYGRYGAYVQAAETRSFSHRRGYNPYDSHRTPPHDVEQARSIPVSSELSVPVEDSPDGDTVDVGIASVPSPAPIERPATVLPSARPDPPRRGGLSGLSSTPADQQGPFTGVVVDCRGLGLLSSMSPRLRTQDGREVWGSVHVSDDYAVKIGIAGFMENFDQAVAYEPRVGSHPLILRAIGVTGGRSRSEAVLSDDDAAWLRQENRATHFLERFHVMFVVDPLRM